MESDGTLKNFSREVGNCLTLLDVNPQNPVPLSYHSANICTTPTRLSRRKEEEKRANQRTLFQHHFFFLILGETTVFEAV